MRAVPEGLAAKLASGATTVCRCWVIERGDGVRLGFTDHDRDLPVNGVVCTAASGLNAAAVESTTGLSVDTQSVSGALSSDAITEADIERGAYDGATVTALIVDWQSPADRLVLSQGRIGEIRRSGGGFEAEVASLSERLNQPVGRAFLRTCHLPLGGTGCGVDLTGPSHHGVGNVNEARGSVTLLATGLDAFAEGWFEGGTLNWTAGGNAGVAGAVRRHVRYGSATELELWLAPPVAMVAGETFEVTAGCDRSFRSCRVKFGNAHNFRGFPHMPGDDWAAGYPREGGAHDGGSLFRG